MFRSFWRRRPPQQPGLATHDAPTGPDGAATHYATLGVSRHARPRDIVVAYRRLAKRLHPDVSADPAAAGHFKRASAAYEVLADPVRRLAYDASLDAAAADAPPARTAVRASRSETAILVGLAALAGVGLLYVVALSIGARDEVRAGSSPTDVPAAGADAATPSPSEAPAVSEEPSAPAPSAPASAVQPRTPPPAQPTSSTTAPGTPSAAPTASASPQPTATPTPSPPPAPIPLPPTPPPATPPPATPLPTATPSPTATPARCVIPNVIGARKNSVQPAWVAAGFGTLVQFLPGAGNYVVASQNLAAGTTGACATTTLTVGP